MRIFTVDFNRVISDPSRRLTDALQLGYENLNAEVRGLIDGEHIIVAMPGELWAEAVATHRDDERGRYWYGELVGPVHYDAEEGAPPQHSVTSSP